MDTTRCPMDERQSTGKEKKKRFSKPKWLMRLLGRKFSNSVGIDSNTTPLAPDGSLASTSRDKRGNDPDSDRRRGAAVICRRDACTQTSSMSRDCATEVDSTLLACSDKATCMEGFVSQDGQPTSLSELILHDYIIRQAQTIDKLASSIRSKGYPCSALSSLQTSTTTPTSTLTSTPTPKLTSTPTSSLTSTPTITSTPTLTSTPTPKPTLTSTPTSTLTSKPTPKLTSTLTFTPTPKPTLMLTHTPTPKLTSTQTSTPAPKLTPTPTLTPKLTPTLTPKLTPTFTPTPKFTPTLTLTPTQSDSTSHEGIYPSRAKTHTPLQKPTVLQSSDHQPPALTWKKAELKRLELAHLNNPKEALAQSIDLISSDDWEKTIAGLNIIDSLVQNYPDFFISRRHEICLTLIQEVMNLRSCVSRVAMATVGTMYTHLRKGMDPELEGLTTALLQKMGIANKFIREDVESALDRMVQSCTPAYVMKALLGGGLRHLNSVVRACAAQHLANLLEKVGATWLLSDTRDITESILPAVARLAQDSSQEVRHFGRPMLSFLASHPAFNKMAKKYLSAKDIAELRGITQKAQEISQSKPSQSKPQISCSVPESQSALPSCRVSQVHAKVKLYSVTERDEYIENMKAEMGLKDFQQRMEAISKIVADCQQKPDLVAACKFPVFDCIVARLQESNRKINQHTLEALETVIPQLKDHIAQVINILVPAIVENHLNCKIKTIHNAADSALNSLIRHLDNTLLLDVFLTKAQLLSGKAKGHMIFKVADIVTGLYPRKPQMVEHKVLPLLWSLLVSSNNTGPTASLCRALHAQMGQRLRDSAVLQPADVKKALSHMLQAF